MNFEDYADYQLSLALKDAGLDELCVAKWAAEPDGFPALMGSTAFVFRNSETEGRDVAAPFLWQAQKWLRERFNIDICVWRSFSVRRGYHYQIVRDNDWDNAEVQSVCKDCAYETSLAEGIEFALELIKKEE